MRLPPLLPVPEVLTRLRSAFPEGSAYRRYVTREMAAKTVFVMLYVGAVEDSDRWLRPDQVTRMTDSQAGLTKDGERRVWLRESMRRAAGNIVDRAHPEADLFVVDRYCSGDINQSACRHDLSRPSQAHRFLYRSRTNRCN